MKKPKKKPAPTPKPRKINSPNLAVFPKILKITVTQEHIDKGKRGSPSSCPIGLAVKDTLPGIKAVDVTNTIDFRLKNSYAVYKHTKTTNNFIEKFDQDRPVKPFSANLKLSFSDIFE